MARHMSEKHELIEKTVMVEQQYGKQQQDMRPGRDRMVLEQQTAVDKVEKEEHNI